jgi:hypothetical protein
MPVVRISILRCEPEQFAELRRMTVASQSVLAPGIEKMKGCLGFFVGADEATSSLTNTSLWETLQDAQQLDRFQPMLDLGKEFVAKGAIFERPIMNYTTLWQIGSGVR